MSTTTSTRRLPITAPFRAVKAFLEAKFRALAFNLSSATMTLSIEDGHARLLVLNKNRVVAWRSGEVAQPPEPDSGADLPLEAADANRPDARDFSPLGSLLEDLPNSSSLISRLFFWRPRRRVVADLPLHVPLLRHVPLPDAVRRGYSSSDQPVSISSSSMTLSSSSSSSTSTSASASSSRMSRATVALRYAESSCWTLDGKEQIF